MNSSVNSAGQRALVTGANGFVGRNLCLAMQNQGWIVRGAVRSLAFLPAEVDTSIVGDIDERTDWLRALDGVDVVVHLAARVHVMKDNASDKLTEFMRVNFFGTINLAEQAARNGVKRFVYVSSIKVNGEKTLGGKKFSAADDFAPQGDYAVSKSEAEQALRRLSQETGMEVVIARPPLVYGPGVKGNFAQMLKAVSKGMPLPLATVHNKRDLIYVRNLVDALIACSSHPAAAGQTYLLSDGEAVSTPDLLRQLAAAMNVKLHIFAFPVTLLKFASQLSGKSGQIERLLDSLQVNDGKIREQLGWAPPYTLQQGMQATAEWYKNTQA